MCLILHCTARPSACIAIEPSGQSTLRPRLTPFTPGLDHRRPAASGYGTLHLAGSKALLAILAVEVGLAFIQRIFWLESLPHDRCTTASNEAPHACVSRNRPAHFVGHIRDAGVSLTIGEVPRLWHFAHNKPGSSANLRAAAPTRKTCERTGTHKARLPQTQSRSTAPDNQIEQFAAIGCRPNIRARVVVQTTHVCVRKL